MAEYLDVFPARVVESTGPVTITDAGLVSILKLEETGLPNGTYLTTLTYEWDLPDTNDSALFRVDVNGEAGRQVSREPKDSDDIEIRSLTYPLEVTDNTLTIEFFGGVTNGGQDGTVERAVFIIKRIA